MRRAAAILDPKAMPPLPLAARATTGTPRLVATVTPTTGALHGIDAVRIDAAEGTLMQLARLRRRYRRPALLDLPGPDGPPRSSPLTTTELLIYAGAEGFEWVGLRGVEDPLPLQKARQVLPPVIRVVATVEHPRALEGGLQGICALADVLVLRCDSLETWLGAAGLRDAVGHCLHLAGQLGIPCLLAQGGLSRTGCGSGARTTGLGWLAETLEDGAQGLVLCGGAGSDLRPQADVDMARRLLTEAGLLSPAAPAGARLDASSGWESSLVPPGAAG